MMAENTFTNKPTKRGIVVCPGCLESFSSRWKPETCPNCQTKLGGKHKPQEKKLKLTDFKCVRIHKQNDEVELYSIATSTRDTRVFALHNNVDENENLCYHEKCLRLRGVYAASSKLSQFICDHLKLASECVEPIYRRSFSDDEIASFAVAEKSRTQMLSCQDIGEPTVIKVSPKTYAVKSRPTASEPNSYVHVRVDESQPTNLICLRNECKGKHGTTKQVKRRKLCLHLHYVILARKLMEQIDTIDARLLESLEDDSPNPSISWMSDMKTLGISRASTLKSQLRKRIPYEIPIEIVNHPYEQSQISSQFVPDEDKCSLCGAQLSSAMIPNGASGDKNNGYFLASNNPFKKVTIKTKKCCNSECRAITNVFPYQQGLFNVCNKLIIAIDILLEWREGLKEGFSVSNMIDAKLRSLLLKIPKHQQPQENEMEYIRKLLYNGFYAFEAMTVRDLDETICGFCGIVGELYCGDGNAKNCCSIHEISAAVGDNARNLAEADEMTKETGYNGLEAMLEKVHLHLIEKNTYAKTKMKFSIPMNQIPPIIPPKLRRAELNTEVYKRSVYLEADSEYKFDGDPVLLAKYMKENNFSVDDVNGMCRDELLKCAEYCHTKSSGVSTDKLRHCLQALYATILVGNSPCHGFTKAEGHTGGFYHFVCRHGCTVASKFLILMESVRDAADLYLSLRHPPITLVCDTACTFVRHLNNREPELTNKIWGAYDGCFEIPDKTVKPRSGISVPEIVPSEFRATNISPKEINQQDMIHPISGKSRRFVLGDRFHTATNPHKSPLCRYHDIEKCAQSNAVKTSYQESENSRKNNKRLRSSCMQSFHVHYFYNFLMDFYQNESIIKKQRNALKGLNITQDEYFRFVIQ